MSHQKIKHVMSTDVTTVREDTPFKDVVRALEQRDISAAPVVDVAGHVLGVVSQADLLVKQGAQEQDWTRSPMTWWRRRRDARRASATTAGRLMTTPVVTITANSTVVRAARELNRYNIKRLPVVDADGKLVGVVSCKDLLSLFLRKDEDIRADIIENVFERGIGMVVNPSTVRVTVHDGRVELDGQLDMKSLLPLVEQVAQHIDGVVDVTMSMTYRTEDTHVHVPPAMGVDITHEPWRD
jgi:CBS domain-containing protein